MQLVITTLGSFIIGFCLSAYFAGKYPEFKRFSQMIIGFIDKQKPQSKKQKK